MTGPFDGTRLPVSLLLALAAALALPPAPALAVPIETTFKFAVPVVPGRDDKTALGGLRGWGGLFISFTDKVDSATFSVNPVLNDCVDQAPFPIGVDDKVGALPADAFFWRCDRGYQLDSVVHPGLTVTVKVLSEMPVELLTDPVDAANPTRTFWWQKARINNDGTISYTGDTDPIKMAAIPLPLPGSLGLILAVGLAFSARAGTRPRCPRTAPV